RWHHGLTRSDPNTPATPGRQRNRAALWRRYGASTASSQKSARAPARSELVPPSAPRTLSTCGSTAPGASGVQWSAGA
ncbi:MAG: hypothetical protein ACK55Z_32280, partial [bacterium]